MDGTGIAQAGAQLGVSVVNGLFDNYQQKKQMEWNEKMQDKQNAWNLNMWNMQNEYNSYANQVERMREAGINPMFQNAESSNATELTSADINPYQRATSNNLSLQNPVSAYLDAELKQAEIANKQADTAYKGEITLTEEQRREKIKQEIQNDKQALENMIKSGKYTEAQTAQINKALEWYDRIQEANLAYTESKTEYTDTQKKRMEELLEGEKMLQSKTLEEFEHRWNLWAAEAAKDSALAGLTEQDIANYGINHFSNEIL